MRFILILSIFQLCLSLRLIEVNDSFIAKQDGKELFATEKLMSASFYKSVSIVYQFTQNITYSGKLCWLEDISNYRSKCEDQDKTVTQWIAYTNGTVTNVLDFFDKIGQYPKIKGIIFQIQETLFGFENIADPDLILFAQEETAEELFKYTIKENTQITVQVGHEYIPKCYLIYPTFPYYTAYCICWAIILIYWIINTFAINKRQSMTLQKILTIIPSFKIVNILLQFAYYLACPWDSVLMQRYLQMLLITTNTLSQTIILSLLMIIGLGWGLIRFQLSRNQATQLTLFMGGIYLAYSGYNIAEDINLFKYLIMGILIAFYFIIYFKIELQVRTIIKFIKIYLVEQGRNNLQDEQLNRPALELKISMYKILMLVFFILQITNTIAKEMFTNKNDTAEIIIIVVNEGITLIVIGMVLFVFRSRKWPQFFEIGLIETIFEMLMNEESQQLDPSLIAPIYRVDIKHELLTGEDNGQSQDVSDIQNIFIISPYQQDELQDEEEEVLQQLRVCYKEK